MMVTVRSFIAIELSDEVRLALADLQKRLQAKVPASLVRWTAPASIHLTLHFLGEVAASEIEQVSGVLAAAASICPPFRLTLGGLGCFPNSKRPRIIWTGLLEETAFLLKLQRDLGERLQGIGFTPEARPYSPHLTLGRVKDGVPSKQLAQLGQVLDHERIQVEQLAALEVTEISLMKSELKPAGPIYTQLVGMRLTGS